MLLQTFEIIFNCEINAAKKDKFLWTFMFSFLFEIHVGVLGHMGTLYNMVRNCYTISIVLHNFTFPSAIYAGTNFSESSPIALLIFLFLNFSHHGVCEVVFFLHIPSDLRIWISLMTNDAEYLLMWLLDTYRSSLKKYLFFYYWIVRVP